ncbi:MAG: hypothetical protein PHE50_09005, partial [Dehalococcoidales bacterium]|nr:hypothetical protein [Dehalococcoidales bacterium]
MNLIDRYINEVGEHLPARQRSDILKEIRSLIEDLLAEKSRATGRPNDEKLTIEVLKEMGRPEKVAASYLPPRYLIGPELFPVFWLVLKIVLFVVFTVGVLILAVRIAIGDIGVWLGIGDGIGNLFNWLVLGLGWVVVTFAIIELVAPKMKIPNKEKEWDPAALLKKPDTAKIPLATPIVGIIGTLVALVIFNLLPGVPVIKNLNDGEWRILLSLSDAFKRILPLINIAWVLTIAFHCVTLVQRRWSSVLRLAYIGLQVFL